MDANKIAPKEIVSASRKLGAADAKELALKAARVLVFKGKKVTEFIPDKNPDETLVKSMLGPTGNLRAPTIVSGKTVLIGFNEEEFSKALS